MARGVRETVSEAQWKTIRLHWENDPRPGFTWIVSAFELPVSRTAVRKRSLKEGWVKKSGEEIKELDPVKKRQRKSPQKVKPIADELAHINSTISVKKQMLGVAGIFERLEGGAVFHTLSDKQKEFVMGYVNNSGNVLAACNMSGISTKDGYRLSKSPAILQGVAELRDAMLKAQVVEGDRIIRDMFEMTIADRSEITAYHVYNCRHCWGIEGKYQCTPQEYKREKVKHEIQRAQAAEKGVDIGEFSEFSEEGDWFNHVREPNPECMECSGVGRGEVVLTDTRLLSHGARRLIKTYKHTKMGIEIEIADAKEQAKLLLQHFGLLTPDQTNVQVNIGASPEELSRMYHESMEKSRRMNESALKEREMLDIEDVELDD